MIELARYIYVAVRSDGAHKIGVSSYLDARRDQVASDVRQDVEYVCLWPARADEAFKIERMAHRDLAAHALGGEWFKVTALVACGAVIEAKSRIAEKRRRPSITWDEFYAAECERWGKEAVDANFLKMNADWDAYWLERGSAHYGFDLYMATLAEFERALILERTNAGLAAARAKGRIGGRQPIYSEETKAAVLEAIRSGMTPRAAALLHKVSLPVVYKWRKKA